MYGAEIWGINYHHAIERVHFYACKRYICGRLNSSNYAVVTECGRYPLHVNMSKRCTCYWLKILKLQDHRYAKKCCFMQKCYDEAGVSNWVSEIRQLLYKNGFVFVWESQGVENEKQFVSLLIQRLKDQYLQNWHERVSLSAKLVSYIGFTTMYNLELYLHQITNRKYRRVISKFRISAHDLKIERGRYSGVDRNDRICKWCRRTFHFVLICIIYKEFRQKYIPIEYRRSLSIYKFNKLMNVSDESTIFNLALYLFHARERRKQLKLKGPPLINESKQRTYKSRFITEMEQVGYSTANQL